MRLPKTWAIALLLVCGVGDAGIQGYQDWVNYDAPEHGFSMLVPAGTHMAEKEYGDGWGELWAEHEGVKLYGLAQKGVKATPEEIEKVGAKLTGIPSSAWKEIARGENKNGWLWYRTVEASSGGKLVIGDCGVGSKASYMLVMVTTESDYHEHMADYKHWYESIMIK